MMAAVENTKYEELCRLCASKTTLVLAVHIFESEGNIRQISRKIDTCLPVKIQETDELPKMICENCLYKLELFCDFRERSLRTERLLVELYKEIISDRPSHSDNPQNCRVSLDNSELIMVQHNQLVNYHNLENVSEISLTQIGECDDIAAEHDMILAQHSVDMNPHSLDNIDLSNHALHGQDHSSHSLHAEESSLVDSSSKQNSVNSVVANLDLIHQSEQVLADQMKLPQEFHLSAPGESLESVSSMNNFQVKNDSSCETQPVCLPGRFDKSNLINMKYEDSKLCTQRAYNLNETGLDIYQANNVRYDIENFKQEDSNSNNSLHIEDRISDVSRQNSLSDQQLYNLDGKSNEEPMLILTNAWFYCNVCGLSSDKRAEFDVHYESHFLKCEDCSAVFTSTDLLNLHRKEVHGASEKSEQELKLKEETLLLNNQNNSATDNEGSEADDNGNQIEDHDDSPDKDISKQKLVPPKVCKECGKTYKTNYKLLEHMRKHTGEKPFKCKSCEKAFRSKIGLAQHEAKHTGKYDLSCPTCGKGFQCKSYLMVHQRVHSSDRPFPCTTCGQNFKTKQSLLDHTNRHLGVKPFICDICGRGFITKGLCRAHQKTHTGLDNRKYSCKICSKMFVSKSYLQTHLRIHTGEKPFICEVCGKGFLTRVDLKIHLTMHTGEKSYVCEMCGKAFARRDALRCHRRSHTGERPYSCDLCGQTFTQFTPMAIHKRLHTGERPYSCETCGKTFVSRSTMMSHAKKHVR